MRLILALLLMVPMLASGAVRELTECGTLPGSISAESPFDLDACNLQNGDDITTLLTDIAAEWGNVYVRAPSQSLWVYAGYTVWTVDNFYFLEDQSVRNTFTIRHKRIMPFEKFASAPTTGNAAFAYTLFTQQISTRHYWNTTDSKMYRCSVYTSGEDCDTWTEVPSARYVDSTDVSLDTCTGAACNAFFVLWAFQNFDNVKIGGSNLSMTFQSGHPGLANCNMQYRPGIEAGVSSSQSRICDFNRGVIDFRMSNGTNAVLADVRANIRFAQHYALYTSGSSGFYSAGGASLVNKITNLNVAGMMYATGGVFFHTGVRHAWSDPDRFVISDPYVRASGWTGEVSSATQSGLPIGCPSFVEDQNRMAAFSGYYTDSITGGATFEYGAGGFVQRYVTQVGNGISDPYVARIRDPAVSGPGTGLQAGVRVKKTGEAIFFKGDPASEGTSGVVIRHVNLIRQPGNYGAGPANNNATGCEWTFTDGPSNFARFEADPGLITRDWHWTMAGDFRTPAQGGDLVRQDNTLVLFAYDGGEIYGHTVRIAEGTQVGDTLTLVDRSTVTGSGTWDGLSFAHAYTYTVVSSLPTGTGMTKRVNNNQGTVVFRTSDNRLWECREVNVATECTSWAELPTARNSTITDTNVAGVVTVSADVKDATISNVNFTGSARAVITIGANSDATVDDLCVPNGSTITGTGTLTYEGTEYTSAWSPFAIPNEQNCNITANDRPDPPGVN